MATLTDFLSEWHSDSPFIRAHTSGSTGSPKPIDLLKSDMRISAQNTIKHFKLGQDSILACPLSAEYIAGKMMAVRADSCNGKLLELPVSNSIDLPCRVDFLAVVPSQLESVLKLPNNMIGALLIGGAPMTDAQELAVLQSGLNAWIGYGMTETCSHVALRRVGNPEYHSVGDIWFTITHDNCLVINSNEFSWQKIITRDVVELLSPHSFIWIGRADNVIISGGMKIHPELLESEIRRIIPDLPDFYIVAQSDSKWGQVPVMVVEGRGEAETLLMTLKTNLSDSRHTPKRIIFTESLPRTSNNKIKRVLIN